MQTNSDDPDDTTEGPAPRRLKVGGEIARLRLVFLLPLTFATLAVISALVLALYWYEQKSVQQGVMRIRASAQDFYEDSVRYDARALQTVMDALRRDTVLQEALAQRDRQRLLMRTATLFDEFKKDYAITHFYFSGTDRVNLLRVHAPNRYGDVIDRITTLDAERSGTTAFGVELGPMGTFTLRLVTPWYDDLTRQLIGYVELGMETDRVLQKLRDFFGVDVFVLVDKAHLERKKWEDGMRALGRTPDWDQFPDVVVGGQASQTLPILLAEQLSRVENDALRSIAEVSHGGASYRIAFLPLMDAGNRKVAQMVLVADVSRETNEALNTVVAGSLTALAAGIVLLVFFNWQVVRIGRRIEGDAKTLEKLATHDGLTGLHNHRAFYNLLADEVARSRRYRQPLSLLMIDIDHFKQVNDTHGHQTGDAILRGLSHRLAEQVRDVDRVFRYGGEEIAVMLPGTENALDLAERLRSAVADAPFDTGTSEKISITVSIGLASIPRDADTEQALVAAADAALYAAKRGGRNQVCIFTPAA